MTVALPSSFDPMRPSLFTIVSRRAETDDTFTVLLKSQCEMETRFLPGQFNMLYLFGRGEVPISMSGDPANTTQIMHTIRCCGSVTNGFSTIRPGETVGVRGPFGTAWPMNDIRKRNILFIAGGLGLAPLRPAILYALANRTNYGRLSVLYGTRSPSTRLFIHDLSFWAQSKALDLQVTVDHSGPNWHGRVGVITTILANAPLDIKRTIALICGPEVMMRFVASALLARGVASNDIYVSLERNMKCAIGQCGHCQIGPKFVCRDGPVFRYDQVIKLLQVAQL